jgi:hypothetical protein
MKVYLDDERPVPDGWIGVKNAQGAINLLKTGNVTDISLDHDLGLFDGDNGYVVICWIEEALHFKKIPKPNITIHTSNPSARYKMELTLKRIDESIRTTG